MKIAETRHGVLGLALYLLFWWQSVLSTARGPSQGRLTGGLECCVLDQRFWLAGIQIVACWIQNILSFGHFNFIITNSRLLLLFNISRMGQGTQFFRRFRQPFLQVKRGEGHRGAQFARSEQTILPLPYLFIVLEAKLELIEFVGPRRSPGTMVRPAMKLRNRSPLSRYDFRARFLGRLRSYRHVHEEVQPLAVSCGCQGPCQDSLCVL